MGDERPYLAKGQRLLEKYEIVQDINTGSFGHVVMCRDVTDNGRKVAVKVQDRSETRYHQGYTRVVCSLPSVLHKITVATIVCVCVSLLYFFVAALHVACVLVYLRAGTQDFKIEIDILVTICSRPERPSSIVNMLEHFQHAGRWCIAFECLGPSL